MGMEIKNKAISTKEENKLFDEVKYSYRLGYISRFQEDLSKARLRNYKLFKEYLNECELYQKSAGKFLSTIKESR